MPQLHTQNSRYNFLKICFPHNQEQGVEETMICFIKIQSEDVKMTWDFTLFIFCMIYKFSKCDGLTILWIISIK